MKNSIDIYAPIRNWTGYAEVCRNFIKQLYYRGWKINLQEHTEWSPVSSELSPEDEELFSSLEKNVYPSTKMLNFCLPEQAKLSPDKTNICFTMFEASRDLPHYWKVASEKMDHIIVPTRHNYRLWNNTIETAYNKMSICPLGICIEGVARAKEYDIVDHETNVNINAVYKNRILVLQEFISRKNMAAVLRAYFKGCQKNPEIIKDTCLVLKVNSNSGTKLTKFSELINRIKAEFAGLDCNVFVFTKILKEEEIYSFINSFTHFFSMSLGEGWDLTCAKAAALGKQLIVPENTSYTEYLNDDIAHFIPCHEDAFPIEEPPLIRIYENSMWTMPDVEKAADYISKINTLPKLDPSEHLLEQYSWDACGDELSALLESFHDSYKKICPNNRFIRDPDMYMMGCKSLENQCGIAEYTKTLHAGFKDKKLKLATLAGDTHTNLMQVEKYRPSYFFMQNEYQFNVPRRIRFFTKALKERGIKSILTQHTYNQNAYEYNKLFLESFDAIIVHNMSMRLAYRQDFGPKSQEKIHYLPMPVDRITELPEDVDWFQQTDFNSENLNIGFFGFCYYHKGVDRLLSAVKYLSDQLRGKNRDKIRIYIYSTKPPQDAMNYYEQCLSMLEAFGINDMVYWVGSYLNLPHLIFGLRHLDYIFMPYDDYGGIAASAALSTCVQAENPIIYCSSDSPCFSSVLVEDRYRENIRYFANYDLPILIYDIANKFIKEGVKEKSRKEVWDDYFENHSWEKIVEEHLKICQSL